MSATTAESRIDLDALEAEVQGNIAELEAARRRLSFDALGGDSEISAELESVESELGAAQGALARVTLARAELERRDGEARQAERDERERAAYAEAQQLQVRREAAARAVDRAAEKHVAALVDWVDICRLQQAALVKAALSQVAHVARARGFAAEASFAHALRPAVWKGGSLRGLWERLPFIPAMHRKPLSEADARPVEPAEVTR